MSDQRFAVLIGSGSYPNEPKLMDLHCPPRDVEGLAAALRSRGSFASVAVVKDAPHHEALLEINRTLKRAGKEDLVFIYYSGHGKLDLANRLYLCTPNTVVDALEATAIPVHSIRDYADVASCYQVVLVLDCCFSGAAGGVFARSSVDDQLQLVSRGRGTYIMTASTAVQVALEKEQERYSAFTKHIVEGLETEAADVDEDGLITMDELYQYVHEQLRRDGFQEPMKWAINVRGELLIARTGKSPRAERRKRIREKLIALATEGMIPDRLLSKALGVLAVQPGEMTTQQKSRDAMLDRLDEGRVRLGDFVEEWLRLDWAESLSGREGRVIERPAPQPTGSVDVEPESPKARTQEPTQEPTAPTEPAPQPLERPVPRAEPERPRGERVAPSVTPAAELSLGALWPAVAANRGAFWKLVGATVSGVLAGLAVSVAIAVFGRPVLRDLADALGGEEIVVTILIMTCCGAGVGLAQWWAALRASDVRWIRATTIGWGLGGGVLGAFVLDIADRNPIVVITLIGLLGAGGAGLLQAAVLRSVKGRGSWILISGLGPLVGVPVGILLLPGEKGLAAFGTIAASVIAYAVLTSAGLVAVSPRRDVSPTAGVAPGGELLTVRLIRAVVYALLAAITLMLARGWL